MTMLQSDKERAAKLAELFTPAELDILTDRWIMSREMAWPGSTEDRLEDILWEAANLAKDNHAHDNPTNQKALQNQPIPENP